MRRKTIYLTVLFLSVFMAGSAWAGNVTWLGGPTKYWDGDGTSKWSWDTFVVPVSGDDCFMAKGLTWDPTIDGALIGAPVVVHLVRDTATAAQTLTLQNGGSLITDVFWWGDADSGGTGPSTKQAQSECRLELPTGTSLTVTLETELGYDGYAFINMDGGDFDFNDNLRMGSASSNTDEGGYAHIQLDSGTLTGGAKAEFSINTDPDGSRGSIDITGGTMDLLGDWTKDRSSTQDSLGASTRTGRNLSNLLSRDLITAYADPNAAAGNKQGVNIIPDPNGFVTRVYTPDGGAPGDPNKGNTIVSAVYANVNQASNWSPLYAGNPCRPTISWTPAAAATAHKVYFGSDPCSLSYKGEVSPNSWDVNETLGFEEYSYYRIDEVISGSPVTGITVDFRTKTDEALPQRPGNNATRSADEDANIVWVRAPGDYNRLHRLYIAYHDNNGVEFDTVSNNPDARDDANDYFTSGLCPYIETANDVNIYTKTDLVLGKEYYWRVDSVITTDSNYYLPADAKPGNLGVGPVRNFTTPASFALEDFESYVKQINGTWVTQVADFTAAWQALAEASIDIESTSSGNIKTKGNASLKFTYDNTDYAFARDYYSEAVHDFTLSANGGAARDFTNGDAIEDAEALSLVFVGTAGNAYAGAGNQLYFALEDSDSNIAIVKFGDHADEEPNALENDDDENWTQWDIDLAYFIADNALIDLTQIDKMYVGVGVRLDSYPAGTSGGIGTLYVDNINRWPRRCRPSLGLVKGDVNSDCKATIADLRLISAAWLRRDQWVAPAAPNTPIAAYDFNENTGNIANDSGLGGADEWDLLLDSAGAAPAWNASGRAGSCLMFDNTKVIWFPDPTALMTKLENTQAFTFTVWLYGNPNIFPAWGSGRGYLLCVRDLVTPKKYLLAIAAPHWLTGQIVFSAATQTSYHASGNKVSYNTVTADIEGQWNHWAFVWHLANEDMRIYQNGNVVAVDDNFVPGRSLFGPYTEMKLGMGPDGQKYDGRIDDLHIYDYALPPEEIISTMGTGAVLVKIPFWAAPRDVKVNQKIDMGDIATLANDWYLEGAVQLWP